MSAASVIPSAPEYPLYPPLPTPFRLQKISDIQQELESEIDHYRRVAKKYQKAFSVTHGSAIGLGSLTALLSTAGIATALTGVGVIASIPLGGVAALTGFSSTGLTAFSKQLENKRIKHEKIYTLAMTKHNTVSELVSKALNDNQITDGEFNLILRELQKYHDLKAAIRSGINKPQQPDVEKIKSRLRKEMKQEFSKKLANLGAESRLNLKD